MASPYLLPDGNVLVAFSGGRTSGYMLRNILDANGPLPKHCIVSFQNTGRERPETLDFVSEIESRWNVPILRLEYRPPGRWPLDGHNAGIDAYISFFGQERYDYMRAWWIENRSPTRFAVVDHANLSRSGEPFEALVLTRKFLPNQQARFCTAELKVHATTRYLIHERGWKSWKSATGIRKDEPKRWKKKSKARERWQRWMPLVDANVARFHVSAFWQAQPFDLRLPNVKGNCWLGNCDGCFLKSEANIAAFTRDFAEDARWWEGMEVVAGALSSAPGAFWSKRYSRAEMRRYMERQGDWALSTDGALCQKDDGECFA